MIECGCRCMMCGSADLKSVRVGATEPDGYFDMHHTCNKCNTHFDHLDGDVFESCKKCDFGTRPSPPADQA